MACESNRKDISAGGFHVFVLQPSKKFSKHGSFCAATHIADDTCWGVALLCSTGQGQQHFSRPDVQIMITAFGAQLAPVIKKPA